MQSAEESLRRLKTDYIDLYQVHVTDPETPREETLAALDDLVRQGKVRAIGEAANGGTAADLVSSQSLAAAKELAGFVSMQAPYNLLARDAERDIIPRLRERNMSLVPYSPLANGLLTGKYRKETAYPAGSRFDILPMVRDAYSADAWAKVERLRAFAAGQNMTMVELAIAWLLAEPVVASVIAGATKSGQVTQNVRAAGKRLSESDRATLERITG
jgi:aryl-alcohol dehydrogenase-like predicted oxidoreductase